MKIFYSLCLLTFLSGCFVIASVGSDTSVSVDNQSAIDSGDDLKPEASATPELND